MHSTDYYEHRLTELECDYERRLEAMQVRLDQAFEALEIITQAHESFYVDWERMANEKGYQPEMPDVVKQARKIIAELNKPL